MLLAVVYAKLPSFFLHKTGWLFRNFIYSNRLFIYNMSVNALEVGFDVFPNYTSPFQSYIKQDRLFSFAQLHSVVVGPETFQPRFTDAVILERGADEDAGIALRNPRIPEEFGSEDVFDHILSGLGISYLDHASIPLETFDVVGDRRVYHASDEAKTIQLGSLELHGVESDAVIGPSTLRTSDEHYAELVKQRLQQIKSYFASIMDSAAFGVSHKHYIQYLLEAFPGRVQVRQLPAVYTEFEPLNREARSLDDDDDAAWRDLAATASKTARDLDRDLSMDERRFLVETFVQAGQEYIDDACKVANSRPRQFAENYPRVVMRLVDTKRVLNDQEQLFNARDDGEHRDLQRVETALFDKIGGGRGDH